jgi:biopolymer transport protein ExbB/TolQ
MHESIAEHVAVALRATALGFAAADLPWPA